MIGIRLHLIDKWIESLIPCCVCGRSGFFGWYLEAESSNIMCGICVAKLNKEVRMAQRQVLILAGPTTPATLTAVLPLVTYAFDRILGHLEGEGSRTVTLKQVQSISRSVCVEHGAAHLADNVLAAVNASIDSMLGGAVTASRPSGGE